MFSRGVVTQLPERVRRAAVYDNKKHRQVKQKLKENMPFFYIDGVIIIVGNLKFTTHTLQLIDVDKLIYLEFMSCIVCNADRVEFDKIV